MADQKGKSYEIIAGDLTLDLVNTLDFRFRESGPEELLTSYDDLLRFVAQSGLVTEAEARRLRRIERPDGQGGRVLKQVIELREAVASVLYAWLDGSEVQAVSLSTLERYFKQASAQRRLIASGPRLEWSWEEAGEGLSAPFFLLAQAAADLLLSERVAQLRSCASSTCKWLFLDASKNHSRRWCDMRVCGNRMKARRFQARQTER